MDDQKSMVLAEEKQLASTLNNMSSNSTSDPPPPPLMKNVAGPLVDAEVGMRGWRLGMETLFGGMVASAPGDWMPQRILAVR
jgi:hypothetical protein